MNTQKLAFILLIACMVISCGKSKVDNPIEDPIENPGDRPDPVAHGTPIGDAVQKSIGTGGGTIAMPDNGISVSIPAGVLAAETTFSIQEVSSTIGANGLGKSYRLLPENVQFKQDVEITFAYNEDMLAGKFEDLLFMAYQDAKGYWRVPKNTVQDKANKTLKVKTRHFSDWSGFCSTSLTSTRDELAPKEEAVLTASYFFTVSDPDGPSLEDLLSRNYTVDNEHVEEWSIVSGEGKITPKEDGTAIFKAPENISALSTAKIQLKFKNMRNPRTGAEGLVLAYTDIKLLPTEYMEWTFDGEERFSATPTAQYITSSSGGYNHLLITGRTAQTSIPLFINAVISEENTYSFSTYELPGKVKVTTLDGGSFGVNESGCPGSPMMIGYVDFQSVDLDKYIKGTVFGTLVYDIGSGCSDIRKPISGSFRVKASKQPLSVPSK